MKQELKQKDEPTIEMTYQLGVELLNTVETLLTIEDKYLTSFGKNDQLKFIEAVKNLNDLLYNSEVFIIHSASEKLIRFHKDIIKDFKKKMKRVSSGITALEDL